MRQGYFITGTDTGVGKTWVTVALMCYFRQQGYTVSGMKPVAAGCEWIDGRFRNDDALLIQQHCSFALDYQIVNPYSYELAVSPHLAGIDNPVQLAFIKQCFEQLESCSERIVVEGAGGWYSPLSERINNADLACMLDLPVILVVAMRLGCLNQACLSLQAIMASNVTCIGWVAVCVDSQMAFLEANIQYLENHLAAPLLAVIPYALRADFEEFGKFFTIK